MASAQTSPNSWKLEVVISQPPCGEGPQRARLGAFAGQAELEIVITWVSTADPEMRVAARSIVKNASGVFEILQFQGQASCCSAFLMARSHNSFHKRFRSHNFPKLTKIPHLTVTCKARILQSSIVIVITDSHRG